MVTVGDYEPEFNEGDGVRVVEGPFVNFCGDVERVFPSQAKLMVTLNIFGRKTPVELGYEEGKKL